MAQAALQQKDVVTGRTFVEFKGSFCVYPDMPLAELNENDALAFQAGEKGSTADNLYALIYHPHSPPRIGILEGLKTINDTSFVRLVDWGLIEWPQPVSRRICILLEKIPGKPFVKDLHEKFKPFSEDDAIAGIIEPGYRILESFTLRGLTHRNLRTTNIFLTEKGRRGLVIGNCLDYYPASKQPVLFEPIESALTMPPARGEGSISDDLYSFGVLLSVLLLGHHPFHDFSDEKIIGQKLISGSFGAIIGNSKISVALLEPIKGLLIDDPHDRWTLKDLKSWVDGRRLNARQPIVPKRASRPFSFEGNDYYYLDILLLSLMNNVNKGMSVFKNHGFHHWLKRSLALENLSLELEAQYEALMKSGGGGTPEKLTSRLLMNVNPLFPIFFKQLSFQVQGIGNALAYFFDKPDNRQITAEVIASRLPTHWIGAQPKNLPHITKMLDLFEKAPRIISSKELGQGIERVLYDLNPHYPCVSPLFKDITVLSPDTLLITLEEIATLNSGKTEPFDKHILAFIASRGRAIGEALVASFRRDLTSQNPALAVLRLYAQLQKQMQKKIGNSPLPHLAKWVLAYSPQGVVNYKNIERQKNIEKQLAALAEKGDLQALLEVADNMILALQDRHDYNDARKFYFEISSYINMLEDEKKHIDKVSYLIGSRIAAVVSTFLAVLATLIVLFNFS